MQQERKFWVRSLIKIAEPVLISLSQKKLCEDMPVAERKDDTGRVYREKTKPPVMYLEACGRLLAGMAPWLEAEVSDREEFALQRKYRRLARAALDAGTDPASPDFFLWRDREKGFEPDQPVVDAAYLAHALLRAPDQLFWRQGERVRKNILAALRESARIAPLCNMNWILFGGMIQAALYVLTGECDVFGLRASVSRYMDFYLGDGVYGDGKNFACDYYNSFVIHPMLDDILSNCQNILKHSGFGKKSLELHTARIIRFSVLLERMIAPDGSYPVVGRSSVYRMGCFQALAQAALKKYSVPLPPAQIRCALEKVIRKTMSSPEMFDEKGFLRVGVYGFQPSMRDIYISTGSLYMCSLIFLPLGLSSGEEFWTGKKCLTSWEKIWSGQDFMKDGAIID